MPQAKTKNTRKTLPDRRALESYGAWLAMERQLLNEELWPELGEDAHRYTATLNAGFTWHRTKSRGVSPAERAEKVLELVGVDWKQS